MVSCHPTGPLHIGLGFNTIREISPLVGLLSNISALPTAVPGWSQPWPTPGLVSLGLEARLGLGMGTADHHHATRTQNSALWLTAFPLLNQSLRSRVKTDQQLMETEKQNGTFAHHAPHQIAHQ